MSERKSDDGRPQPDRRPRDPEELTADPDFAEEHTPSDTDPPNAKASDGAPDERWDKPTEV
ncbi:hypothetical protein AB0K60_05310 [Thermopolyspora sp. NPDC052614]|uniref:hypothetical protein n=1 Tax=Thermopolyspora sp. NPDC052614 TaxID=3155682 RepID=UPI00341AAAA3